MWQPDFLEIGLFILAGALGGMLLALLGRVMPRRFTVLGMLIMTAVVAILVCAVIALNGVILRNVR
jgi:hypothetical protein